MRIFLLVLTLSTATGGVVMIYQLLFLIPIVALLGWAARLDRKRRRREVSGHDLTTAAYTVRQDAERRIAESSLNVTPGENSGVRRGLARLTRGEQG